MDTVVKRIRCKINSSKKKYINYNELVYFLKSISKDYNVDECIDYLIDNGFLYKEEDLFYCYELEPKVGQIKRSRTGSYNIILENGKTEKIKYEYLSGILPLDKVLYNVDNNNNVRIVKLIERSNPNVVCSIKEDLDGKLFVEPQRVNGHLNINIDEKILRSIGLGKYVLVKVGKKSFDNTYDGKVIDQIFLDGKIDNDLAFIAFENGFRTVFPDEVMEEAKYIPNKVLQEEINERKDNDFRDWLIFTIDGANTKDIDDAIGLRKLPNGNYELGVHIANVSHYVKYGSKLFNEAKKRSTSVYMLNTVIPMLPEILSNGICSLNEGENRLTKSCIMEIDANGNVVDSRICDGVIRSKKKMTYDDVNKILDDGIIPEGYEEFAEVLKEMGKLSNTLLKKLSNRGCSRFANSEINTELNNKGEIKKIEPRYQGPAEQLIEMFMITANETVAEYVSLMDLPFVYRVHEGPDEQKLEEALKILKSMDIDFPEKDYLRKPALIRKILDISKNVDEYPVISSILLYSMSRAKYSVQNIGHFAQASNFYCHFTSPIRRFPDLMVHILLDYYNKKALKQEAITTKDLKDLEKELEEICAYSSFMERQADTAEADAERLKIIAFAKGLVGNSYDAVINMISSKYVTVTTDDGLTGIISIHDVKGDNFSFHPNNYQLVGRNTKQKYKIGHRVKVTMKSVNDATSTIFFTLDENLTKKSGENKKLIVNL